MGVHDNKTKPCEILKKSEKSEQEIHDHGSLGITYEFDISQEN